MTATLKFGDQSQLLLDLSPDIAVFICDIPATGEIDVATATKSAIESPLNFPPLSQAVVPGDHVVLALGPGVPQAADVIAAIVPALLGGGVATEDITVLRSPDDIDAGRIDPRFQLPESIRDTVQLVAHSPDHPEALGYLAADAQGAPIYLNRLLCDADLVIPIGCLRPDAMMVDHSQSHVNGNHSVWNETLYPTFADRSTIEHFSPNGVLLTSGQRAHHHRQVDQVAWRLGVQTTAQVVPGGGDRALRVLAGSPDAVFRDGRTLCQSVWQYEVPNRASLVIAGLSGGKSEQTWANVARALQAALRVVHDGGAIVLCTELDSQLGAALMALADATDPEVLCKRLRKLRSPDAPLARLLAQSLDRVTVYLLSRLREDLVTSLGFAYVGSGEEIARLAGHHSSCILVSDAQYAVPIVAGE